MIQFAGINPETGAPQFYTNEQDANGNYIKEITEDPSKAKSIALDKQAEPKVTGGLSNTLRYKWFDLSFMFLTRSVHTLTIHGHKKPNTEVLNYY